MVLRIQKMKSKGRKKLDKEIKVSLWSCSSCRSADISDFLGEVEEVAVGGCADLDLGGYLSRSLGHGIHQLKNL